MTDALHPVHDAVPVEAAAVSVIAEWEPGTFLENLAPAPDGAWWVTSPTHHRVDTVERDGSLRHRVAFPAPVTGIVVDPTDPAIALVACGELGQPGWRLYRLRANDAEPVADLGDVRFANGMTWYDDELVVADSARGALAVVDLDTGRAATVRADPLLTSRDPAGPLPGVNGLAATADGALLLTSTERSLVLRLRGALDTAPLEVVAERLVGDDLTTTPDGAAYVATHTYHSVLRLDPDGSRRDVATHAQGVAGPTSVAVDPDRGGLVVCTTGGLLSPPAGAPEPARLLRVAVAVSSTASGASS
jgi:sugar lactone lactonase YvrE